MADSQAAPSPNSLSAIQSDEARAGTPSGFEPGQGYKLGKVPGRDGDPIKAKVGILISFLLHAIGVIILGMSALLAPKRPSVVPVFELVNLEKPKLRPLTPKTVKPPTPKPPEEVKAPEAPKLTPKPSKAVVPKKPEPKVVKEPDPDPRPVKEVVQEQQVLTPVLQTSTQDSRLGFWAARVKKKVDMLWNPPAGIDILGTVKAVVNFKVARDGSIVASSIAESSGNDQLDELAMMVIKRLEGIPPIPENFPGDELEVRCEFPYSGH